MVAPSRFLWLGLLSVVSLRRRGGASDFLAIPRRCKDTLDRVHSRRGIDMTIN